MIIILIIFTSFFSGTHLYDLILQSNNIAPKAVEAKEVENTNTYPYFKLHSSVPNDNKYAPIIGAIGLARDPAKCNIPYRKARYFSEEISAINEFVAKYMPPIPPRNK